MSTAFYKIPNMICSGTFLSALRPILKLLLPPLLPNLLRPGRLLRQSGVSPLILFVLYQFWDRLGIYGDT